MGYANRTISYLKRNGFTATKNAVLERIDQKHMDPMQKKANEYTKTVGKKEISEKTSGDICFSILVPTYETKPLFLKQMVESVLNQSYQNFELILADASKTDQVQSTLKAYEDERIVYLKLEQNAGISENTNVALRAAKGDYIGLLDHDDLLKEQALSDIYEKITEGGYAFLYTDEDKVSGDLTTYFEPNFKPDFNFDYLLSNNYICHFAVIRSDILKELGFRKEYDGAQDYDLFLRVVAYLNKQHKEQAGEDEGKMCDNFSKSYLRSKICHISKIHYHWRAHEASTADNPESKRYAYEAGKRALEDFLKKAGWKAKVEHSDHLGFYEVTYLPGLFEVRTDVASVSGYSQKNGIILHGPVLDQKEQFVGMRTCYSGYLHRAHMPFEIDKPAQDAKVIRNPYFHGDEKDAKNLYLPMKGMPDEPEKDNGGNTEL